MRLIADPAATVGHLVSQANSQVLQAIQHQEIPIQDVIARLRSRTSLGDDDPYQVTLALNNARSEPLQLHEINCTPIDLDQSERRPAVTAIHQRWVLDESPDGLRGTMTYRTGTMNASSAGAAVSRFRHALNATLLPDRPAGEIVHELLTVRP
jgi:non-ribosomal peptide synthetase component F